MARTSGRRKASRSTSSPPISEVSRRALPYEDFDIAEGNYYNARDGHTIDTVVIHTTVGSLASAIGRFGRLGTQVSAHWIIGLDGTHHRGVEERFTAYHAGDWTENLRSIGIEHVDDGAYDDERPDSLYAAAGARLAEIRATHPITRILAHRDVHATRCPDALDVGRIIALSEGVNPVTFDPIHNVADEEYLKNLIRAVVMGEDIAAYSVWRTLTRVVGPKSGLKLATLPKPRSTSPRRPATHMRGNPPKGHPAR